MVTTNDALFSYDRDMGVRYVCGADESGYGGWAGPLVAVAVRLDYQRLDENAIARLEHLNDCKKVTPRRRAALLPVIMEVADTAAILVVSAAQIDNDGGVDASNKRALGQALEAVAVPGSVNLVDWYELPVDGWGVNARPRSVKGGDGTSAAIAAASIIAKETRDALMRGLDIEYPKYGFAAHKGYGGDEAHAHTVALKEHGLSPVHRLSNRGCQAYMRRD